MEFIGDIARKTGKPSLLAVEAVKTERAYQIAQDSGLFYVPRVVNFDAEAGVLEFERLRGLSTLLELAVKRDARTLELTGQAARALAAVHDQLILPDEMKEPLPAEWMDAPDENVFIHGDYGCANVCLHEPSGRLVVLDWSGAPLLGRTPTFGSRYFDVFWFAFFMFRGGPNGWVLNQNAEDMAKAFVQSYVRSYSAGTFEKIRTYSPRICQLHKKSIWHIARPRAPLRAVAYLCCQPFMYARLCAFLRKDRWLK